MESFIKDTRHRPHQVNETTPRKLLATQSPLFVSWERVYPYVSDDLASIHFRAPNVLHEYARYREMSPTLLSSLIPDNYPVPEAFETYVEHVKPPKGKELLALFLHGQQHKNLAAHVEHMVPNDLKEQQRIAAAIRSFATTQDLTAQVGILIRTMPIGHVDPEQREKEEEKEPEATEETPDEDVRDVVLEAASPGAPSVPLKDSDHWENPVLKAYRLNAHLPTRFSVEKTVKQILVATAAPHMADEAPLARHQESIGVAESGDVLDFLNHITLEDVRRMVGTQEAQDLYRAMPVKPKDNREWLKTLIGIHQGTVQAPPRFKKPELMDPELARMLLGSTFHK